MSQKLLPKENSIYTNVSAKPFTSQTQQNATPPRGAKKLGIDGSPVFRELPTYNAIEASKIIKNDNGYINIAQDAPRGPGTGYSAFGTPASSVDIVCGRMSCIPKVSRTSGIYINDCFSYDAARIYASETTDLEDNFSMPRGDNVRQTARSGVGIQADVVGLKGKSGIKLCTSPYGERNSKGGKIRSGSGIELIAGTYTNNLQPLVLGDNLENSLKSVIRRLNSLSDIVMDLAQVQNDALLLIQAHTHPLGIDPASLLPGAGPSPILLASLPFNYCDNVVKGIINGAINKINLLFDEANYLSSLGSSYINSDLNRTN